MDLFLVVHNGSHQTNHIWICLTPTVWQYSILCSLLKVISVFNYCSLWYKWKWKWNYKLFCWISYYYNYKIMFSQRLLVDQLAATPVGLFGIPLLSSQVKKSFSFYSILFHSILFYYSYSYFNCYLTVKLHFFLSVHWFFINYFNLKNIRFIFMTF